MEDKPTGREDRRLAMIWLPRGARRWARSLLGRLRTPDVCIVHHPGYMIGVPGIPIDPLRADRILAYLLDATAIRPKDVSHPIPVSLANVSRVHAPQYLESLDRPETLERVFGFPVTDEQRQRVLDYQRLVCGGTVQATRLALRTARIGVNLGGGFHHASPDQGMGFSIFNDVAIAVARLRAKGFREPVLVVDLDLHDGNGTRRSFAEDRSVHTFSIHNETWDDVPAVADTCIALGPDIGNELYLDAIRDELPGVIRGHRPGLVFYLAGTDPAVDDVMGNWKITGSGVLARDRFVVEQLRALERRCALVVLLAGGYGRKTWRYSARFFSWLLTGRVTEPTEDIDAVVRRFRRRLVAAPPVPAPLRDGGADWTLSEADLNLGPARASGSRVLGELSKLAIELALERLGILDQVRSLGFVAPTVVVDVNSPLGHTIRLFGDPDRTELLMELRLNLRRNAVPGMKTLYVEWLLLQNPRQSFGGEHHPLPGQEHPGLGLLREVVGWLIVMSERLGLDGIAFAPAHYYMAALGRRHLEFVRPEAAATFEALRDAVLGLDLAEASRVVDAGSVIDEATGAPVAWPAPLMVLPITERLRERVSGSDYETARLEAGQALRYRLRPD